MADHTHPTSFLTMGLLAIGAALLGFVGGWAWQASGAGRGASEQLVRDYILEHPEVLPQAMERLQARDQEARLAPVRSAIETPYPGAVLGNPEGKVTLVEFTDYACPYCRSSVPDVEALIAANPDLKVVVREYPILSKDSVAAARMALAAADQGHYAAFHKAMFAQGRPNGASIDAAAREAGLDLNKAKASIAAGKFEGELENNVRGSQALGLSGTPAWVIGKEVHSGAVGRELLAEAITRARGS